MFGVYVLTGNELTASKALVALSLINIIRIPFTNLPTAIVVLVQVSYFCKLHCVIGKVA